MALFSLGLTAAAALAGAEPFPFSPGSVLGLQEAERLHPWLPAPLWSHRHDFLFFEGMRMEIGPPHRDYSPPRVYREAASANRGRVRIGPEGTLIGYVAGPPFPPEQIDCQHDPEAGTKWIWDFVYRWQGFGLRAHFLYTYWERGSKRPLIYQGRTVAWLLKHRPEPQFRSQGGNVFPNERRAAVVSFAVTRPPEVAGARTLTFRYEDSYGPPADARPEDTWIYVPDVRRIRKISQRQRSSAVAGTDFAFDDLFSFSGLPPQYRWRCLREQEVLAPTNTRLLGHPYARDESVFGPSGLSLANDRWELRRAVVLEMRPKDPHHPYSRKEIWIDRQTAQPLYSFAYDRAGVLWKIIYHAHRWSEDDLDQASARRWYPAWEGVDEPRDLRVVADFIYNVQTGSGNRLEFWDSHGTMPKLSELKRLLDVRQLRRRR